MSGIQVGFVGLGNMGMPMAKSLLNNGFVVNVFDLNQLAMAEITALGAVSHKSLQELAIISDPVISMVRDEADTEKILFDKEGLWDGIRNGGTLIISSTVSPSYCRRLYAKAMTRNIKLIDAPVSDPSGQSHVLGELTIMIGGDKDIVDKNWPIFQAMGKTVLYLGQIGSGQICKLVNQINAFNIGDITRESLNMGVKAGLDLPTMVVALSSGLGSTQALQNLALMLKSEHQKTPNSRAPKLQTSGQLGSKDRSLALELGKEVSAEMPISNFISQLDSEALYKAYSIALAKYLM
jgi:3-hydroxyisobutyrate dehydrogenase-like beta-hydroxyacid dehydrogenase